MTTQGKTEYSSTIRKLSILFIMLLGAVSCSDSSPETGETEKVQPEQHALYVKIEDVKRQLDCDNSIENDEKSEIFDKSYRGKRLAFPEIVQSKYTNTEYSLSGWIGEGTSISKFNCLPHIILSGDNKIQPEVNFAYKFDCRISNFCEEGSVIDGQLEFDDCTIVEKIK